MGRMSVISYVVPVTKQAEKRFRHTSATHPATVHILITGMDDLPRLGVDDEKGTNALGSK